MAVWVGWASRGPAWATQKGSPVRVSLASEDPLLAAASSSTLGSPWDWVYEVQEQARQRQCTLVGLLRSEPLPAPDPQWQVYTRLDLVATPQAGKLTSVLFAENTRTQALQVIYQASASVYAPIAPSDFALILPLAWQGRTLLAREYEGLFQTDLIWERAVIWSLPATPTEMNPVQVWEPPPALGYAELLGWDPQTPGRVLFAVADSLGEVPRLVSVGSDGQVLARPSSEPVPPGTASLLGEKEWREVNPAPGDRFCHSQDFGVPPRAP